MTELNGVEAELLQRARNIAKSKRNTWPGMPLSQVPLSWAVDMHSLIAKGHAELVERPGVARPETTHTYLVAT